MTDCHMIIDNKRKNRQNKRQITLLHNDKFKIARWVLEQKRKKMKKENEIMNYNFSLEFQNTKHKEEKRKIKAEYK